jgi:hypothetical protein
MVGDPSISKTNKYKYAEVIVVGQDMYGRPLVSIMSDKAKSGGFWKKLDGQAESLRVSDSNLMTQSEVNKECIRLLDAVSRDVWEGTIVLAGMHLSLWDNDNTSSSFGSGKILKLYWSPLGMSAVLMKVNRIIIKNGNTEVYLNNVDPLLINRITNTIGKTDKLDAFLSPVGLVQNTVLETYTDTVIASANDVYCELKDTTDTDLAEQDFVLCEKFTDTKYNICQYHAEFEASNALGTNKVRYVRLYDSGGQIVKVDLQRTESNIDIDEKTIKTKTNRLIVIVNGKAA